MKLCDGYGVLGNLKYTSAQGVLHYIALVTGCVSMGKLGTSEVGLCYHYLEYNILAAGVQDY